ncbi:hypothetical protein I6F35_33600 [Bradyrhizobium sp. BRP22]|nr:hypothetical protein [Bradyrhizobium sp. BRP22]
MADDQEAALPADYFAHDPAQLAAALDRLISEDDNREHEQVSLTLYREEWIVVIGALRKLKRK